MEQWTGAGNAEGQEQPGIALPAPCTGTRGGRKAQKPREQERRHTQRARGADLKGNQTEPMEHTDSTEWRTGRRGEGTAGWDDPPHAPRGARGKGRGRTQET